METKPIEVVRNEAGKIISVHLIDKGDIVAALPNKEGYIQIQMVDGVPVAAFRHNEIAWVV
jgi:hypothetical protein